MAKRLLIFGGYGFVGGVIAKTAASTGWDVIIAGRNKKPGLMDTEFISLDITDRQKVTDAFRKVKPDAVVNVAAVSNIDLAEREKKLAWSINVDGARNIAEACKISKTHLVFFSSDAVFSGQDSVYSEKDRPEPVNYYGYTKAEAEKAVFEAWPESVVLRISLVLGFPVAGGNFILRSPEGMPKLTTETGSDAAVSTRAGKTTENGSFIAGLEKKLSESVEIQCPEDEYRTPVDVHTLAQAVLEMLTIDFSGLLHIGSTGSINRYELTKKAAELMGFDTKLVTKILPDTDDPNRAPRHKNGILDVTKAVSLLQTKMLTVNETIEKAIRLKSCIRKN